MSYQFYVAIAIYIVSVILLKFVFKVKRKPLERMGMWSMIAGIVFLCQPLSAWLFHYGIAVLIYGLMWWNIAINSKPDEVIEEGVQ